MDSAKKERWKELCEFASEEQDPEKLVELVAEIDRLLLEKEQRLKKIRANA
jgi:predicted Zn-dependent protease